MEPTTGGNDEDRISQLPDPIIHDILSRCWYFNMKKVVRTCILSKRWRDLWASMPNLSFQDDDWLFRGKKDGEDAASDFAAFVNSVLLLRDTVDVHRFRLQCRFDEHGPRHVATWMQYAVNHNVRDLEVTLTFSDAGYEFPSCIFSSPTLEKLSLSILGPYVDPPRFVQLGRLRNLQVNRFTMDAESLKVLVSGCPVLEDLCIFECKLYNPDISSSSLKTLEIISCEISGARMRISVPSLQSLSLGSNDIQRSEVLLENLSSLVKASFQTEDCYRVHIVELEPELLKFVGPKSEGVLRKELPQLQTFHKLKKLELYGNSMLENFPAVVRFLQCSPNLKYLTLTSLETGYEQPSTSKKWFACCHRNVYIISDCGPENDSISNLMIDYFNSKCGCRPE